MDSLTAQLRLVEAGLGLGLLPHAAVEEGIARGTLFRVLPAAPLAASVPVVIVHRRGAYLPAAAPGALGGPVGAAGRGPMIRRP